MFVETSLFFPTSLSSLLRINLWYHCIDCFKVVNYLDSPDKACIRFDLLELRIVVSRQPKTRFY